LTESILSTTLNLDDGVVSKLVKRAILEFGIFNERGGKCTKFLKSISSIGFKVAKQRFQRCFNNLNKFENLIQSERNEKFLKGSVDNKTRLSF